MAFVLEVHEVGKSLPCCTSTIPNAAIALPREGLARVHPYFADRLPQDDIASDVDVGPALLNQSVNIQSSQGITALGQSLGQSMRWFSPLCRKMAQTVGSPPANGESVSATDHGAGADVW